MEAIEEYFPLQYRIAIGLTVFAALAIYDFKKFGWESKRLREYGFVLAAAALTVVYAVFHDLLTSTISPEYFTEGKGLEPDHLQLRAAWLGARAAIGPGILIGALLTLANNPSKKVRQLPYSRLATFLVYPLVGAIVCAILFGVLGYYDIRNIKPELIGSIQQPARFVIVWGIHWGTYVGGFSGLALALVRVRRERNESRRDG